MITTITFAHGAQSGHPHNVSAGQTVTATMPAGCVLMAGQDPAAMQQVAQPYVAPVDGYVSIDCVTYTAPVTDTLEIA